MAGMLRARLFGGLAVEVDGRAVADVPGMKPRALLAYLLTRPGLQSRARVAGVFWPDVLDTSARASLRSALWSVRAALEAVGGGEYLVSDRAGAGIAPDLPRWIDAEEAERLLAAGDRASLEGAIELAARPFLPEVADDWAIEAQDAWRERLVGALERLAALAEAEGDMAAAIEWTRRALRHDRLREAGHRGLIRRLADAGERAQAMAAYRRCRDVMAAELGIPPSAETRALAEGLRAAPAPAPAAAPEAAPAPSRAAPAPAPPRRLPLRGREAELAALREALAAAVAGRGGVAAIEGPAGIGKSRLAAELVDAAAAAGARTASGAALDLDSGPPYAAWSEALRGLVRATPAPSAEARWPADLALLCPAVESAWGRDAAAVATPDLERLRIFEAVVEAIAWSARSAPTVVLLEDLHRADPASLALLGHAGRRLGDLRALIVAHPAPVGRGRGRPGARRRAPPGGGADRARPRAARPRGDRGHRERRGGGPRRRGRRASGRGGSGQPADRARGRPCRGRRAGAGGGPARLGPRVAGRPARRGPGPGRAGRGRRPPAQPRRGGGDPRCRAGRARPRGRDRGGAAALARGRPAGVRARPRRAGLRGRARARAPRAGPTGAWPSRSPAVPAGGPPSWPATCGWPGAGRARCRTSPRRRPRPGASGRSTRRPGSSPRASPWRPEPAAEAELWLGLADVHAWRGDREALDAAFGRARALLEATDDPGALAAAWADRGRWLRTSICYPRESLEAYRTALDLLAADGADAPEVEVLARAGSAWAESVAGDPAAPRPRSSRSPSGRRRPTTRCWRPSWRSTGPWR